MGFPSPSKCSSKLSPHIYDILNLQKMLINVSSFSQACLALHISATFAHKLCTTEPWLRRECTPGCNSSSWRDVCVNQQYENSSCSDGQLCQNVFDKHFRNYIACVPFLKPNEYREKPRAAGLGVGDPWIIGASGNKFARNDFDITMVDWSVKILRYLGQCGVAAVILSEFCSKC